MSDDDFDLAPLPFKPDQALLQLQRGLRDLKLAARGHGFELRGKRVVELAIGEGTLDARLARRLAMTPEWDRLTVRNAAEQRKLLDEVKKRLAHWEQED